jgi:hypothetical protein
MAEKKECYYGKINGDQLKISMLECLFKYEHGFFRNSDVNNSFNENAFIIY